MILHQILQMSITTTIWQTVRRVKTWYFLQNFYNHMLSIFFCLWLLNYLLKARESGSFRWMLSASECDCSFTALYPGSVVIAAITSCTNTSNPSVMLGAGLLAKKAVELGLSVKSYIKTSLSPGSGVVTYYLQESGVIPSLEELGWVFKDFPTTCCSK